MQNGAQHHQEMIHMANIESKIDGIWTHYEKHLADTGRPSTPREVMRYMVMTGYIKPEMPPKPEYNAGLMIYAKREPRRRNGWSEQ